MMVLFSLNEYLEIKASIMLESTFAKEHFPNLSGYKLHVAQVCAHKTLLRFNTDTLSSTRHS